MGVVRGELALLLAMVGAAWGWFRGGFVRGVVEAGSESLKRS
jgi:hypothetical protein